MIEHGKEATKHLNEMLFEAQTTGFDIEDISSKYTKEEKRIIREGEQYTHDMLEKFMHDLFYMVESTFSNYPDAIKEPTIRELPNTYIFRAALCNYLCVLDWGAYGGARDANPVKHRNDMVDMNFAAYATYFDGIISADIKLNRIYKEALLFIDTFINLYK